MLYSSCWFLLLAAQDNFYSSFLAMTSSRAHFRDESFSIFRPGKAARNPGWARMDHAVGGFSEDQFLAASAELQQSSLAGAEWQLLVETLGISIFRRLDKQSGLYEYKVLGVLEDCPPSVLADVYMDLNYRKQWDQYVKELYEKEVNGQTVTYWEVKYPFPMSNRDYVYIRQRRDLEVDGNKIYVILAQSTSVPQFPEKSGVIRVQRYKQSLAVTSDGKQGSKVFMYYFDNPGGQIPSWLINWAAKNGVPNFLKDMGKACQNYPQKNT